MMRGLCFFMLLIAAPAWAGEVCFKIPPAGETQSTACLTEYRNTYGAQLDESALAQLLYERACKSILVQDVADTKMAEVSAPNLWETCGDGVRTVREICDDGNTVSGDGCNRGCTSTEVCGNSFVDPGETCDDGNVVAGDGCSALCATETP